MDKEKLMILKYHFQKLLGRLFDVPIIPNGKTIGYSLIKSEKSNCSISSKAKVYPPFFLHNVKIGDYSYIARNCSISNCSIGRFSSIGPNFCCGLGIHPTNGILPSRSPNTFRIFSNFESSSYPKLTKRKTLCTGANNFFGYFCTLCAILFLFQCRLGKFLHLIPTVALQPCFQ